jgi:hypothetical protein
MNKKLELFKKIINAKMSKEELKQVTNKAKEILQRHNKKK